MSLAKEQKIQNLIKQRKFISFQIRKIMESALPFFRFSYYGYIYVENVEFFKQQGFDVRLIYNQQTNIESGIPYIYIFSISEYKCEEVKTEGSPTLAQIIYDDLNPKQMSYLKNRLSQQREDGNPLFKCVGQIFLQSRLFLKEQGFEVQALTCTTQVATKHRFAKLSYIVPSQYEELSCDELKASQEASKSETT